VHVFCDKEMCHVYILKYTLDGGNFCEAASITERRLVSLMRSKDLCYESVHGNILKAKMNLLLSVIIL
jgi:hypothetical protein